MPRTNSEKLTSVAIGGPLAGQPISGGWGMAGPIVPKPIRSDWPSLSNVSMEMRREIYVEHTIFAAGKKYQVWVHSSIKDDDDAVMHELFNGYRPISTQYFED